MRRLWSAVEKQFDELERRRIHVESLDLEREGRSLAALIKVFRELILLDSQLCSDLADHANRIETSSSLSLYDSITVEQVRQKLAERLAELDSSR